jgi:CheY-like chemotaxis protein
MSDKAKPILVIGDEQGNGKLLLNLLGAQFADVWLSFDASTHAADVAKIQPAVLVLAFNALDDAVDFLQSAHDLEPALRERPHATIVLCDKRDVQKAFELCRARVFDDYVLFWPVTHDGSRLPMAVVQALRNVELQGATVAERPAVVQSRQRVSLQDAMDKVLLAESEATASAMRKLLASSGKHLVPVDDATGPPSLRYEPYTVLFVEDDPEQHTLLRLILEGTEMTPVFAPTATRAMQMLTTLSPGIILVDVNLPDGSGVDLIRSIRAEAAFSSTPIITVTGNRTRAVVLAAMAAGAVDFVAKPYGKDTLLAKLRRATANQRQGAIRRRI